MAKKSKISPEKAREMLHNPPHGKPLTDKQRKYFGYLSNAHIGVSLPNYNDSSISLPPNFVGQGYNKGGKVYNGAWGGTMQMGGNLPGAAGFMYARQGAPSNGKYAKKTKSSAQNGGDIYPIEYWKKQGIVSPDTLQRGVMYKVPYIDQKKLYNIPVPHNVNPNDYGYITTPGNGLSPNALAKRKMVKNVGTYDISGTIANSNHPQGANVNFQSGGS